MHHRTALRLAVSLTFLLVGSNAGVEEFPSFGVSLKVPRGWESVQTSSAGQVARWARLTNAGTTAKDVVVLEMAELTEGLSPLAYGKAAAKQYDGEVNREVTMGGLPAIEVRAQRTSEMMTPRQMRIVATKGHLWILSFWAVGKGSLAMKTITSMAKSLEFRPFDPPARHLKLATQPSSFLKGRIKAKIPTISRPHPVGTSDLEQATGIRHFGAKNLEFLFKLQVPEGEATADTEKVKALLARHLQTKFRNPTLKWQDFETETAKGAILDPISLPTEPAVSTFREYHYVLVTSGKDITILSFAIDTSDEADLASYRGLVKQIVRSVEVER